MTLRPFANLTRTTFLCLLFTPLFVALAGCSSSPTAPGGTTAISISAGSTFMYHIDGIDPMTGEQISLATVDTVVANSVSAMGKSGLVEFNDSCNTMLPYCYSTSLSGNSFATVWSKTPPYLYFHSNGDIDVPFAVVVQDTMVNGTARVDSSYSWITLPFASHIGSVKSISDDGGLLLLDSIQHLNDSSFVLSGKTYTTNEVEVNSRESLHGLPLYTRVSYAPGLQTIVRTRWLMPDGNGTLVQVGSKVLTGYAIR